MRFTAIDFETANQKWNSPCSVGIVAVDDGKIILEKEYLIRPQNPYFSPFNISIHGISWEDVKDQPEFNGLWSSIQDCFAGDLLLAHNASFDMGVLRGTLQSYDIAPPKFTRYACTCILARKRWPKLQNHKLNTVADHIGFKFKHHNALEDARACAMIALRCAEESGADSIEELFQKLKLNIKPLLSNNPQMPADY